ncbi:acyltransferase domain-containing protein [Ligilactobacillus sp. WILCCON 0076]|uniref:[acyl-carrier-protein] S-malonyltransferase n=1 Tax=Ligilactobacillus ubinensis TaxID=2876789 RepID=A0A9X2JM65_9LACO|nr:acyltransferase domain-containing protein [Ligilactobacillus ubinensis]MCP0887772.1 acyltransferase domain-containing protein [Ligilactobacillus ubinensis]
MKSLWIFPGQGYQHANMLTHVDSSLLHYVENLLEIHLNDNVQDYLDYVKLQVSISLLQVDQVDKLIAKGFYPQLVAGHSLGIFAAAYACGSLDKENLFKLVKLRAQLMQNAYPYEYGMGIVTGLTLNQLEFLVSQVNHSSMPVYVSNQNTPDQIALSGKLTAIRKVLVLAKKSGASKTLVLKVPVPSHSPLMKPIAHSLCEKLDKINIRTPNCVYLINSSGYSTRKPEFIKKDLSESLIYPVYFNSMISIATDFKPDTIINFPPGSPFRKILSQQFSEQHQIYLDQHIFDDSLFLLNKWKRGLYK